jgi:hypothetical protein
MMKPILVGIGARHDTAVSATALSGTQIKRGGYLKNDNVKRQPISYLWSSLNWEFLRLLADIASYAEGKYGAAEQYTEGRLVGDKSPVNHMFEHLRAYIAREPHDRYGTAEHQLAAIAYNAMMEYFYLKHGGPTVTAAFAPKKRKGKR